MRRQRPLGAGLALHAALTQCRGHAHALASSAGAHRAICFLSHQAAAPRFAAGGSGSASVLAGGLAARLASKHSSGSSEGGPPAKDLESLEAARKRARKATALPDPRFRSHAGGMALSEGAAEAAAACRGEGCERVAMFLMAAGGLPALAETGGCVVQHCPDALGVGLRPLPYTAHAFGNRCEPLYTRGALELVRQLVGPAWRGLEWFSGSSTAWFLARLAHLTSIEAAAGGWVGR